MTTSGNKQTNKNVYIQIQTNTNYNNGTYIWYINESVSSRQVKVISYTFKRQIKWCLKRQTFSI